MDRIDKIYLYILLYCPYCPMDRIDKIYPSYIVHITLWIE